MNILKSVLSSFMGQIFIPEQVKKMAMKIIHISDTPSQVYSSIIRFVSKVQPDIIIHTGDISDDIKLELMPGKIGIYRQNANFFLSQLTLYAKEKLIIVPGNHDNIAVLDIGSNISVYGEGTKIDVQNMSIGLAHKFDMLPSGCSFYMYGHDRTSGNTSRYLNGIDYISLIDLVTTEVVKLRYPIGTNDYRLKRTKIGI